MCNRLVPLYIYTFFSNPNRAREREIKSEKQIQPTVIDFTSFVFGVPEPPVLYSVCVQTNKSHFEIIQLFSLQIPLICSWCSQNPGDGYKVLILHFINTLFKNIIKRPRWKEMHKYQLQVLGRQELLMYLYIHLFTFFFYFIFYFILLSPVKKSSCLNQERNMHTVYKLKY